MESASWEDQYSSDGEEHTGGTDSVGASHVAHERNGDSAHAGSSGHNARTDQRESAKDHKGTGFEAEEEDDERDEYDDGEDEDDEEAFIESYLHQQNADAAADEEDAGDEEDDAEDVVEEDDGDTECPLCCNTLDATERNFRPCPCGYRMCLFCFNSVKDEHGNKCPACRRPYEESNISFNKRRLKRQLSKDKEERDREREREQKKEPDNIDKSMADVRVIQRDLVYVVGLPLSWSKPAVLKDTELFGRFGKVVKVHVNQGDSTRRGPASRASAHVTYEDQDSAALAIQSFDGMIVEGRPMHCTYGTTKYCILFQKGLTCRKGSCPYMHKLAAPADCLTKFDLGARFPSVASGRRGIHPKLVPVLRRARPPPHQPEAVAAPHRNGAEQGKQDHRSASPLPSGTNTGLNSVSDAHADVKNAKEEFPDSLPESQQRSAADAHMGTRPPMRSWEASQHSNAPSQDERRPSLEAVHAKDLPVLPVTYSRTSGRGTSRIGSWSNAQTEDTDDVSGHAPREAGTGTGTVTRHEPGSVPSRHPALPPGLLPGLPPVPVFGVNARPPPGFNDVQQHWGYGPAQHGAAFNSYVSGPNPSSHANSQQHWMREQPPLDPGAYGRALARMETPPGFAAGLALGPRPGMGFQNSTVQSWSSAEIPPDSAESQGHGGTAGLGVLPGSGLNVSAEEWTGPGRGVEHRMQKGSDQSPDAAGADDDDSAGSREAKHEKAAPAAFDFDKFASNMAASASRPSTSAVPANVPAKATAVSPAPAPARVPAPAPATATASATGSATGVGSSPAGSFFLFPLGPVSSLVQNDARYSASHSVAPSGMSAASFTGASGAHHLQQVPLELQQQWFRQQQFRMQQYQQAEAAKKTMESDNNRMNKGDTVTVSDQSTSPKSAFSDPSVSHMQMGVDPLMAWALQQQLYQRRVHEQLQEQQKLQDLQQARINAAKTSGAVDFDASQTTENSSNSEIAAATATATATARQQRLKSQRAKRKEKMKGRKDKDKDDRSIETTSGSDSTGVQTGVQGGAAATGPVITLAPIAPISPSISVPPVQADAEQETKPKKVSQRQRKRLKEKRRESELVDEAPGGHAGATDVSPLQSGNMAISAANTKKQADGPRPSQKPSPARAEPDESAVIAATAEPTAKKKVRLTWQEKRAQKKAEKAAAAAAAAAAGGGGSDSAAIAPSVVQHDGLQDKSNKTNLKSQKPAGKDTASPSCSAETIEESKQTNSKKHKQQKAKQQKQPKQKPEIHDVLPPTAAGDGESKAANNDRHAEIAKDATLDSASAPVKQLTARQERRLAFKLSKRKGKGKAGGDSQQQEQVEQVAATPSANADSAAGAPTESATPVETTAGAAAADTTQKRKWVPRRRFLAERRAQQAAKTPQNGQ